MDYRQALQQAREALTTNHIEDAALEGEILLRHVLDIDRAALFAHLDTEITPIQIDTLNQLVKRRCQGEPSAYITGHKEFFGLDFVVNQNVLIPRPETELLVEKAVELCQQHSLATAVDIGTGSGAIAVSLAVNLPGMALYASDVSAKALKTAALNAARHNAAGRITFLEGNLLEPLPAAVDIIVSNLPYVKKADLNAGYEPVLALDGGEDGLDLIRILCRQAGKKLKNHGYLLLEIGQGQGKAVKDMFVKRFPASSVEIFPDLTGIERVVCICLTPP